MATATEDISQASIPQLISGLINDAREIAAAHANRMRGEIKDEFGGLKRFLIKVAVAVGVGVLGAILLAHTFALVLHAFGLPQWVAYLVAAVVFIGIGLVVLKTLPTDKTQIDLIPETSLADLRRDVKSLKEDVKQEVKDIRGDGHPAGAY